MGRAGQAEQRLLAAAKVEKGAGKDALDPGDARDIAAAEVGLVRIILAFEEQALGLTAQGDHAAALAGRVIEIEAPPAHGRRNPSPSSRQRVS